MAPGSLPSACCTSTGWRSGHCRNCSHRGPDTSYHPWRPPHCEATAFTVTNPLRTSARPPTSGPANAMPASPPAQLFFGTRLASGAFRSLITRLRSPGGIASTSRVRFGSFAVMIACAASISLCHSAWRNTSQRSTCTHCDRGNSTEGDTPSRSSNSAYRSGPAAYVITPFVSLIGFIIPTSFRPIDLSAAQNRTYVLHASVSATCGSFNSIARIGSASIVVGNPTADESEERCATLLHKKKSSNRDSRGCTRSLARNHFSLEDIGTEQSNREARLPCLLGSSQSRRFSSSLLQNAVCKVR